MKNEKFDLVAETIVESDQPNAEESPLQIPGWLANPFQNNDEEDQD